MVFRKMNVSEIDIVRKIYFESFETKVVGNLEYTADNIYVVVNDDNIVGMCMVNYIDHIFSGVRTLYLNDVCVANDFRRRGVATFMLDEVTKMAMRFGVNYIMLTSSDKRIDAIDLYNKSGFSRYDTSVFRKELDK